MAERLVWDQEVPGSRPGAPILIFMRKRATAAVPGGKNRRVLAFSKYHALGNDYIVIAPSRWSAPLTPELIRALCERNTGVGADGILLGPCPGHKLPFVRVFNSDGSEAARSGNGLRIFARFLHDNGFVSGNKFTVESACGQTPVELLPSGLVKADMGLPDFRSSAVPMRGPEREAVGEMLIIDGRAFSVTCLSVGIPACVALCGAISPELARQYGPRIEKHALFPEKTNVQFARVAGPDLLEIEIWERGSGYTLASGSSACAAAASAWKTGLMEGGRLTVQMRGGSVTVTRDSSGRLGLCGPVSPVFSGELTYTP